MRGGILLAGSLCLCCIGCAAFRAPAASSRQLQGGNSRRRTARVSRLRAEKGSRDELEGLSRKDLQALAKANGIKANSKNFDIIEGLLAVPGPYLRSPEESTESHELEVHVGRSKESEQAQPRKRLSVLRKKLAQVIELEERANTDPDCLDADQLAKISRKLELEEQIRDAEALEVKEKPRSKPRPVPARREASDGGATMEVLPAEDPEEVAAPSLESLPKKLATALSYCRVSTRQTCEFLIALGRVTVNGEVVDNPNMRVNIVEDEIYANGFRVTLPPPIDNSALVEADERAPKRAKKGLRSRSGEKKGGVTYKERTRYRWNIDGGVLAKSSRGPKYQVYNNRYGREDGESGDSAGLYSRKKS
jgi:hypothetical protein